jgi:hypothetical protein
VRRGKKQKEFARKKMRASRLCISRTKKTRKKVATKKYKETQNMAFDTAVRPAAVAAAPMTKGLYNQGSEFQRGMNEVREEGERNSAARDACVSRRGA